MREKHGLLLFLATCLPGCGQMHQGYMKRGVSLLLAFCGILAVAILLSLGELCIFLPLVWLFAFFDSYNLRARIAEGTEPEDAFLFGLSDIDSEKLEALCRKRHSLIGWVLVAFGAYLLYRVVVGWVVDLLHTFFDSWMLYSILTYDIPRLLATVLIIALGLWFLRGPRRKDGEEDIPGFVPPEEPARSAPVWDAPTAPDVPPVPRESGEEAPRGDD